MALARGVRLRDDHAFEQRKATTMAVVDDVGPPAFEDSGRRSTVRRLEIEAHAGGASGEAEATFRYAEWWRRDGRGWRLDKYRYDYVDHVRGGRLAYHLHDLPGTHAATHAHCGSSAGSAAVAHFRAYEVDLLEAHDEFVTLFASGTPIDCSGLRPLVRPHQPWED